MIDPIFWLGLSILLVAVSLTAILIALLPAVWELARAARSAEKLFDTLSRELPPTLEAIRLTGMEITDLTDDVNDGVQNAGQIVQQVNQSLSGARQQIQYAHVGTRSAVSGVRAAWKAFFQSSNSPQDQPSAQSNSEATDFNINHPSQTSPSTSNPSLDGNQPNVASEGVSVDNSSTSKATSRKPKS
ncbi:MAG: DUF948 domain-containing protein [Elainellaceae cyanobacterium]